MLQIRAYGAPLPGGGAETVETGTRARPDLMCG